MNRTTMLVVTTCLLFIACGGDEFSGEDGTGGVAGSAGSAGRAGTGGKGGDAGPDSSDAAGGRAGTGGNTGGTAGEGGDAGQSGQSGTGGSGGSPCETGIYLTVDSYGSGGILNSSSGPVNATTFNVHGTSPGNELNVTVSVVNNLTADFTTPQSTTALHNVRLRCQDPGGAPSYTEVCVLPLTGGKADCPSPGCHSVFGGVVKMQLQIDPELGQSGQVRVGIDPNSVSVCDDQSDAPIYSIAP